MVTPGGAGRVQAAATGIGKPSRSTPTCNVRLTAIAPTLSKGFDIACADMGIAQRFAVYPGSEQFPMRHGAQAIGLVALMQLLSSG